MAFASWKDPETVFLCARAFEFIVAFAFGVYIWEFLITLPFDFQFFLRKRPFRWTFVAYALTRYLMLLALIAAIRMSNVLTPVNCTTWNRIVYTCAHACFALASLLLFLRVVAISDRNIYIILFLGAFYLANLGTLIHGATLSRAIFVPELWLCGATNTVASRVNVWMSFGFDLACLAIMLTVLLRAPGGGLWRLLVNQGTIYFIVATLSYLLPAIFLALDLNDAMNEIPQTISLVTMVICASRMYRTLSTFDPTSDTRTFVGSGLVLTLPTLSTETRRHSRMPSAPSTQFNFGHNPHLGHGHGRESLGVGLTFARAMDEKIGDEFPIPMKHRGMLVPSDSSSSQGTSIAEKAGMTPSASREVFVKIADVS
ncbi:hypothetical protein EXIGLDRAFT_265553 [Exidia glandulosa HHB12029]|uniref:Uncharacterized protein n=1 Tax=Exidia glandulosa HHB12029 TaxID=1314781 RepID=A0A165DQ16_EXIGL|nr:hypothetical protein EXIGLDRAFT_265553 [Exidia glandulosa HHB12029]